MPTTPLKRHSLGRILASLLPPSRAGPLPVQTGFPTSLADLVVKNHVRLRMPRKPPQRRPSAVDSSPVADDESMEGTGEVVVLPTVQRQDAAVLRPPKRFAFFRFRPELLALGGAVALLAVWSKGLVAAFTVASLCLLGIESVRSASRRPETGEPLDSCGRRGTVSPIREVVEPEPETDTIMSSCGDSELGEVSSPLWTAALGADGDDPSPTNPKRKGKRSLRKLIFRKLRRKPKAKESSRPPPDGEVEPAVAGGNACPIQTQTLVPPTEQTMSAESSLDPSSSSSSEAAVVVEGRGSKLPLAAFIPVILAGLVAGKLSATALTVLCLVLFSSATRISDHRPPTSDHY